MSNRLRAASSPYLLQHADNPVDWYPWGEEALARARGEDKPIFLSIGYAACHWCHVMAHESFEDGETAALMNAHFVNIKVDREERPDLDAIYMQAVVALTRHGGWPMSVFLTPTGEPFYGGTYFPPVRRFNMPSFREVLSAVAGAWQNDRANILTQSGKLAGLLRQELAGPRGEGRVAQVKLLDQAALKLAQAYDWSHGGWGQAPKFPMPMAIDFLLRLASRGDHMALEMAEHALQAMARGGMYDVVGGGFARYSVDDRWLVPHFEKMLYDNAQLARVYLAAWLLTRNPFYRRVAEETLDFVSRELSDPSGGFHSSLDADSEGEEGRFYVWDPEELAAALPDEAERGLVAAAYKIVPAGNFEGKTVLQRQLNDDALAARLGLQTGEIPSRLEAAHAKMLAHRSRRVRPGTDDKCVVAWNGLMLIAYSEAARYLDSTKYRNMAIRNGEFFLRLSQGGGGRLARTWRRGEIGPPAFLEDYAATALGLLSLYQTDPNPSWFQAAQSLTDGMIELFQNPDGGFFDTASDAETLILRPVDVQDNATPSGGSLATLLLLQMAAFTGTGRYRDLAEAALSPTIDHALHYPTAFSNWLCAADLAAGPAHEVAVVGEQPQHLLSELWSAYRPRIVAASAAGPQPFPALLQDRRPVNGLAAAYVCQNHICLQPVTTALELRDKLGS